MLTSNAMERRPRRYEISKPQPIYELSLPPPPFKKPDPILPAPPPPPAPAPAVELEAHSAPVVYHLTDPAPWSSLIPRPLSDIRELSEPSLMDHVAVRNPHQHKRNASQTNTAKPSLSLKRSRSLKTTASAPTKPPLAVAPPQQEGGSSSYSSTPEQGSFFSIPQSSIPRRSSSFHRQAPGHSRKPSVHTHASTGVGPTQHFLVPNHGTSQSPVKQAGLKLDPITSDAARRVPSRTQIRALHPTEIVDFPLHKHPRVKLELQVSAPVFVGGGSVEGFVKVTVDDNERVSGRRPLSIGGLAVDLVGIEQMSNNRKATFLALGTELIDKKHPPPAKMVQQSSAFIVDDKFWCLVPSCSALPFMISLPLDTGPPPFHSRHAAIRFMLAVTAVIREAGKHYRVRTSQDVHVLPTYDPEKALTSLPSPLTASDELSMPRSITAETLKITAGLHRQVWVSGSSIFVDVHVVNRCRKPVKKLELTLERDILFYKHAAAATLEKSAGQARIFESNEQTVLAKSLLKPGTAGWHGIEPYMSDTRTCELELPRGHGTVRCGKWFEVRYFLNVAASVASSKLVSVQLPIILIHMNSLDVVPNSVAQVAAAIEEKRACTQMGRSRSRRQDAGHHRQRSFSSPAATIDIQRKPSYAQGRAFAAPRMQSLDNQLERRADMEDLRSIIDASPRKNAPKLRKGAAMVQVASNSSLARMAFGSRSTETLGAYGAMTYSTPPGQTAGGLTGEWDNLRGRMRNISSFETLRSMKSVQKTTDQNLRPRRYSPSSQSDLPPFTLGLKNATRKVSIEVPSERSASAMNFRDKLDRSRFEFNAVRRKASGGLKERGINWWEQRRNKERDREREGWI